MSSAKNSDSIDDYDEDGGWCSSQQQAKPMHTTTRAQWIVNRFRSVSDISDKQVIQLTEPFSQRDHPSIRSTMPYSQVDMFVEAGTIGGIFCWALAMLVYFY